jgi:RHS repeat-associated protein
MTLSACGDIEALYEYTPFGEALPLTAKASREKYIGKETDFETGFADHGVRKYSAENGLFTCPDVLWEKYAGWSPYHYTRNNPIGRKDFNGMDDFIYNGSDLYYRDDQENVLWSVPANSGNGSNFNNPESQGVVDSGPILVGSYYVELEEGNPADQSGGGWGKYAWWLQPTISTKIVNKIKGRGGFYLHQDPDENGTAGCIGVVGTKNIEKVKKTLDDYYDEGNKKIDVEVDYDYKEEEKQHRTPLKTPKNEEGDERGNHLEPPM